MSQIAVKDILRIPLHIHVKDAVWHVHYVLELPQIVMPVQIIFISKIYCVNQLAIQWVTKPTTWIMLITYAKKSAQLV